MVPSYENALWTQKHRVEISQPTDIPDEKNNPIARRIIDRQYCSVFVCSGEAPDFGLRIAVEAERIQMISHKLILLVFAPSWEMNEAWVAVCLRAKVRVLQMHMKSSTPQHEAAGVG